MARPACRSISRSARSTDSEALRTREWREIGVGAQILRDLGISSIRLRTSSPLKYVGLSGFGIEIVAYEPVEGLKSELGAGLCVGMLRPISVSTCAATEPASPSRS